MTQHMFIDIDEYRKKRFIMLSELESIMNGNEIQVVNDSCFGALLLQKIFFKYISNHGLL